MDKRNVLNALGERLPDRADSEVGTVVLEGRALSKSKTSLHLAVRTGLVAIPLESITRVIEMPGTKEMVRLVVTNPSEIRHLLRAKVSTAAQSAEGGDTRRGEEIGSGWGVGVQTCRYYDTETATGEEGFDACDDNDAVCGDDDLMQ
jgi:hypothetical protein